jgi:hypothetical protein
MVVTMLTTGQIKAINKYSYDSLHQEYGLH